MKAGKEGKKGRQQGRSKGAGSGVLKCGFEPVAVRSKSGFRPKKRARLRQRFFSGQDGGEQERRADWYLSSAVFEAGEDNVDVASWPRRAWRPTHGGGGDKAVSVLSPVAALQVERRVRWVNVWCVPKKVEIMEVVWEKKGERL